MTCNLAVSIQQARIADELIKELLTAALLEPVVREWASTFGLHDLDIKIAPAYRHGTGQQVASDYLWLEGSTGNGYVTIGIHAGKVQVTGSNRSERAMIERASTELAALIEELGYEMMVARIATALGGLGDLTINRETVNDGGTLRSANVITLSL